MGIIEPGCVRERSGSTVSAVNITWRCQGLSEALKTSYRGGVNVVVILAGVITLLLLTGCEAPHCVIQQMAYPNHAVGETLTALRRHEMTDLDGKRVRVTRQTSDAITIQVLDSKDDVLGTVEAERNARGRWLVDSISRCS